MPSNRPVTVGLIALGCAKNLVDAEILLGTLRQQGLEIVAPPTAADVLIVNTCSFIHDAQEESVNTILESAAVREAHHPGQALIVAGCLPQRYTRELPDLLPEVDAIIGLDQVPEIARIVQEALARRRQRLTGVERPKSRPEFSREPSVTGRDARPRASAESGLSNHIARTPEAGRPYLRASRFLDSTHASRRMTASHESSGPLVEVHPRPTHLLDAATPRFRLTPRHFAYVKIAEGCNHPCTFCIIPRIRGRHRSRTVADVVAEVRRLVAQGTREINLISQDSTYYGLDRVRSRVGSLASPERFRAATNALPEEAATLSTLLRALDALRGDFWIRLLYTHPAHWTDTLIRTIAECPKVTRYIDLPLQHIHDNLLERMRRETSRQHIEDLIRRLRAGLPGVTLRTTFIVGFPGETPACFEALRQFVRETRFERLGVFAYSPEAGTLAARMADQVPPRTRQRRRDRLMADQLLIARSVAASRVGHTLRVLVERPATGAELQQANVHSWEHGATRRTTSRRPPGRGRWQVARSDADAPDIDGRVYVRGHLPTGEFAQVRIVGHTDYDLVAEPIT